MANDKAAEAADLAVMSDQTDTGELAPSKLGTKDHWDSHYEREVANFTDFGDEGHVWFGEGSAHRMVQWVRRHYEDQPEVAMIDLGCGNGHLVFELLEAGFENVIGVDYSEPAVKLAQGLAEKRDMDPAIFSVADLLDSVFAAAHAGAFDLLLDKGTYDAISLSGEPAHRRRFIETAATIVKPETGRFLITSCNWTQDELIAHFQPAFTYHSHVKQPMFTFGGKQGQTTVTVAFQRTSANV